MHSYIEADFEMDLAVAEQASYYNMICLPISCVVMFTRV